MIDKTSLFHEYICFMNQKYVLKLRLHQQPKMQLSHYGVMPVHTFKLVGF